MTDLVRRCAWPPQVPDREALLSLEWLVTNGLGGYASGTLSGIVTRRYHGLLIAALPSPQGRLVMLNHVTEELELPDGTRLRLDSQESADGLPDREAGPLVEFRLEMGLPVWQYRAGDWLVEKRVVLPYQQNTVHVSYSLVEGDGRLRLHLGPALHVRPHEAPVNEPLDEPYVVTAVEGRYEISPDPDLPPLRLTVDAERSALLLRPRRLHQVFYRLEADRGYHAEGELWSPGDFQAELVPERPVILIGSTESWETIAALDPGEVLDADLARRRRLLAEAPPPARHGLAAELVLAADQFVVSPAGRVEDAARARAGGDEVRTVIAGYHWFTDWGRDTMISLEGLTLATGREAEAGYILRTFGHYVRAGLIPNLFPEGEKEGLYHTADATLWFFHALHRYLERTDDRLTLVELLPKLLDIVEHHRRGTRFGIRVDPADGLLRQGAPGLQLTWMDAKVDDWVVTPRRGKAVEINALWYNALRLLAGWVAELRGAAEAEPLEALADQVYRSFNERFWYADGGYLYDVVDGEAGDDTACRPNQVLAISLPHPVLDPDCWEPVLEVVRERLLTPVGLRSLAPGHPDYRPRYFGDIRARDAAYHQGTVWAWLIGPFLDAWLRLHPDDLGGARSMLEGVVEHLSDACIGSISEVFDAEPPFTPRGCIAQAWSVAEALRCWLKTES